MAETKEIPLNKIEVGEHDQRMGFDEETLDGLMKSIPRVGLLYPIIVVEKDGGFLVIDGHTRLEAFKRLGRNMISCYISALNKTRTAEMAFAGNFFRKELTPIELAAAIADEYKKETMTIEELAAGFHKSTHWVERMIEICSWPEDVQQAIHNTGMSIAAASNLALVTDDTYRQYLLANAIEGGVTARTTAAWLQAWRSMTPMADAVEVKPVEGQPVPVPAAPQSPCFVCSTVFPVNQMSHVPLCGECVKSIRSVS